MAWLADSERTIWELAEKNRQLQHNYAELARRYQELEQAYRDLQHRFEEARSRWQAVTDRLVTGEPGQPGREG